MKLLLVRHGESEGNVNPKIYLTKKDQDVALTVKGIKQASNLGFKLAGILGNQKVYSFVSPYKRTQQTWRYASYTNTFETEFNPLLREQEYKVFASMEESEIKKLEREEYGPFWYRFKNAESVADVHQRTTVFINNLMCRYAIGQLKETDTLIIIAHEVVIRTFLMIFKNMLHNEAAMSIQNCEINELILENFNLKSHRVL